MDINFLISELIFVVIATTSLVIAWQFYKIKNGKLRILMIWLFVSKGWVYGSAALFYFLQDAGYMTWLPVSGIRIISCTPMFFVMIRLYKYIRVDILQIKK